MTAGLMQLYLEMNILLLVACGLSMSGRAVLGLVGAHVPAVQVLQAVYALLALCLVLPVAVVLGGQPAYLPPAAQIWSGQPLGHVGMPAHPAYGATVSLLDTQTGMRLSLLTQIALTVCLGGVALAGVRIALALRSTLAVLACAHPLRRSGRLRLYASGDVAVPFSFWMPGLYAIVVPESLIEDGARLRIALRHEAQHHRHGDTRGIYALTLLRGACLLNPAVHLLCRQVHELQELACDAAVAGSRGVSTQQYCDCLLAVAEGALAHQARGTWLHMASPRRPTLLARRIGLLLQGPGRRLSPTSCRVAAAVLLAGLAAAALTLPASIQDRRISAAQAEALAARARTEGFPITMNAQVLAELNQLLGTPAGRDYLRRALQRMHLHEAVVGQPLRQLDLPAELLAVPLVESGYRNLPEQVNPVHGAGVWQMIPRTARASGLTVAPALDERLDLALESQAAARLLSSLFAELGDWRLALLAYNAGDLFVERAIREAGTRDAFRLTQLGYENDPHYLARVMAAAIIIRNAGSLSLE